MILILKATLLNFLCNILLIFFMDLKMFKSNIGYNNFNACDIQGKIF